MIVELQDRPHHSLGIKLALLSLTLPFAVLQVACTASASKAGASVNQGTTAKQFAERASALKLAVLCASDELYEFDATAQAGLVQTVRQGAEAGELGCELALANWGLAWSHKTSPLSSYTQLTAKANKSQTDMINLARMAELGYGRSHSTADAATLFEAAANNNKPAALLALGRMYEQGGHYQRNVWTAARYYQAALRADNDVATQRLVRLFPETAELPLEDVRKVQAIWVKLLKRSMTDKVLLRHSSPEAATSSIRVDYTVTTGLTEPRAVLKAPTGNPALDEGVIKKVLRVKPPRMAVFPQGLNSFRIELVFAN